MRHRNAEFLNHNENADRHLIACALRWRPFLYARRFDGYERKMDDIIILHLSDLHIDSSSNTYSRLLKGLIKDIKKELHVVPEKSVVVVVTGDILHKGDKRAV